MDDFKQLETILEDIVTVMNGNNFLPDLDTSLFGLTEEELTRDYPNEKLKVDSVPEKSCNNEISSDLDLISDLDSLTDLLSTPKNFMNQFCRTEAVDRPTSLPLSPLDCQAPVDYFALSPIMSVSGNDCSMKELGSVNNKRSLDDLAEEYNVNIAKKPCVNNVVVDVPVSRVQPSVIRTENRDPIRLSCKPKLTNSCQNNSYVRSICSPFHGELARKRLKEYYLSDEPKATISPMSDKPVVEKSPTVVLQYRPSDLISDGQSPQASEQQDGQPKKTIGEKFATIRALLSQQSSNIVARVIGKQNTSVDRCQPVQIQAEVAEKIFKDQSDNLQAELERTAKKAESGTLVEPGENLSQILSDSTEVQLEIPPDSDDDESVIVQIIMEPNKPRIVGISRCRKNVLVNTRLTREQIMQRFETYFEGHPLPLIPYVPTYSEWAAWKMGQYNLPDYKCVWKPFTTMTRQHFEQFLKSSELVDVSVEKYNERPPISIVQYLLTLDRRIAMLQTAFLQLEDGDVKSIIPEIITKAYQEYLNCKRKNFPPEFIERSV
ncbi:unnamed protein product [Dimorphilus gyrociliatus]|uniref:Uncharacterized protein n=1 Tax=Dimorphilus gyrociliatus TaxID=2664684 RepID=A0A7I8VY93_9ANNE|nr:unnamed protein product [Dimorphilus gyrociliatus]